MIVIDIRSIAMTEEERATWPDGEPCPICHEPMTLSGRKLVRCGDGTVCHRACSQEVYIAGIGWRFIALPYPTGWHATAYDAARRARTDARRSGASPSEARAAAEAAYRWTWHRLATAA